MLPDSSWSRRIGKLRASTAHTVSHTVLYALMNAHLPNSYVDKSNLHSGVLFRLNIASFERASGQVEQRKTIITSALYGVAWAHCVLMQTSQVALLYWKPWTGCWWLGPIKRRAGSSSMGAFVNRTTPKGSRQVMLPVSYSHRKAMGRWEMQSSFQSSFNGSTPGCFLLRKF